MTLIVGVTGGIASGKSTFVKYLRKRGFYVHDSDEVVKNIYKKPPLVFKKYLIKIGLGPAIKKNKIDKKHITNKIFSNNLTKTKLENFIHRIVKRNRDRFIKNHKRKKTKLVFVDIPLLFERNLDKLFDKIICVLCPKKTRYKRIKKNISPKLFKLINKNQTTNLERKKRSDYCIVNNKDKKFFYKKANSLLNRSVL